MRCAYAEWDAAYVLGSLSPGDRLELERHLPTCADCRREIGALAGMPGLLARVEEADLDAEPRPDPGPLPDLPDTLLPGLLARVRRARVRRRLVLVGSVAAAFVLALTAAYALVRPTASAPPEAGPAPVGHMQAVAGAPVDADVTLRSVAWGTRVDLACTYEPSRSEYALPTRVTYVLVVRTTDGRTEEVGTWRARDGSTMRISAATATARSAIAGVDVRTTSGATVLTFAADPA